MDYRILIPATYNLISLKEKFGAVEDISKIILINNYNDGDIYSFCEEVKKEGVEVYYYPQNCGVATSWNIGLKKLEGNIDLIVCISQFIKIKTTLVDFICAVEKKEKEKAGGFYYVHQNLGFRCFGITKLGLKQGGYFDENFYPAYYEDTDYGYRWRYNGLVSYLNDLRLDIAEVIEPSFSLKNNKDFHALWFKNCDFTYEYYARKWGGLPGSEKYSHPFNNDILDVNYWKPNDRERITF